MQRKSTHVKKDDRVKTKFLVFQANNRRTNKKNKGI